MIDVRIENETELIDLGGDGDSVLLTLRSRGGRAPGRGAPRRAGQRSRRAGRALRAGAFSRTRQALLGAFERRHRFRGVARQDRGVVGAGASAVDNAAEALEAGAARVAMLVRRADVPRINRGMGIGSPGMWHGFNRLTHGAALVDRATTSTTRRSRRRAIPCCAARATGIFRIFTRCEPRSVEIADDRVLLDTTRGLLGFDFLILATGFVVDWSQRPELASLAPHVLLWRRPLPAGGPPNFDAGR